MVGRFLSMFSFRVPLPAGALARMLGHIRVVSAPHGANVQCAELHTL